MANLFLFLAYYLLNDYINSRQKSQNFCSFENLSNSMEMDDNRWLKMIMDSRRTIVLNQLTFGVCLATVTAPMNDSQFLSCSQLLTSLSI